MKELAPKVAILKVDGTNCDHEMKYAFDKARGDARIVHINQLISKEDKLGNFHILGLAGGFSYGDDVRSGKILAIELITRLADQVNDFINHGGIVLGICNGDQGLKRTALLPFGTMGGEMKATLVRNNSGKFECRPVNLRTEKSKCVFTENMVGKTISLQNANGEGNFFANKEELGEIESQGLVVFRYVDNSGDITQQYPQNPTGSLNGIAGTCDPSGRILGMMPHPERSVEETQYPNWRRERIKGTPIKPEGIIIFQNMVNYVKQM